MSNQVAESPIATPPVVPTPAAAAPATASPVVTLSAADYVRTLVHGGTAFALLHTGMELDVFERIEATPGGLTAAELAADADLDPQAARVLLLGLCSLHLLEPAPAADSDPAGADPAGADPAGAEPAGTGGAAPRYVNSALTTGRLLRSAARYLGPLVDMQAEVINPAMLDLTASVRSGTNVGLRSLAGPGDTLYSRLTAHPRLQEVFYRNMGDASQKAFAQVLEHYDFSTLRRAIDVCGGDGTNSVELVRRHPDLHMTVFDQESVVALAARQLDPAVRDRVAFAAGDLLTDALPPGADAVLYFHVFQIWSLARNTEILARCRAALPPGGVCLVYDWASDDAGTGPLSAGLLSPYFLGLASGEGMTYSAADMERAVLDAGFSRVERIDGLGFAHALVVGHA